MSPRHGPAAADPTGAGGCDSGSNRHFRFRVHVEPSLANPTWITGYSYKIYGAIGDKNNVYMVTTDGPAVPGTKVHADEVPEIDVWTWVDLVPKRHPGGSLQVYGDALFDVGGWDPLCWSYGTPF